MSVPLFAFAMFTFHLEISIQECLGRSFCVILLSWSIATVYIVSFIYIIDHFLSGNLLSTTIAGMCWLYYYGVLPQYPFFALFPTAFVIFRLNNLFGITGAGACTADSLGLPRGSSLWWACTRLLCCHLSETNYTPQSYPILSSPVKCVCLSVTSPHVLYHKCEIFCSPCCLCIHRYNAVSMEKSEIT